MDRLEKSSGFKGPVVVASKGVSPRTMIEAEGHDHGDEHAKDEATAMTSTPRAKSMRTRRRSPIRTPGRASPTARSMSPISATG